MKINKKVKLNNPPTPTAGRACESKQKIFPQLFLYPPTPKFPFKLQNPTFEPFPFENHIFKPCQASQQADRTDRTDLLSVFSSSHFLNSLHMAAKDFVHEYQCQYSSSIGRFTRNSRVIFKTFTWQFFSVFPLLHGITRNWTFLHEKV